MRILKRNITNKRRALEVFIVLVVAASVVLTLAFMKKPPERSIEWVNPNEFPTAELVENPKEHDGRALEFTGEAVGERMIRRGKSGEGAWIHLNDDSYMYRGISAGAPLGGYNSGMAIWLDDASLADVIENYGTYKHNGDVVTVTGVYNATCGEHGGDTDIHATELRMVSAGIPIVDPINTWKVPVVIVLSGIATLMYALNRRAFRRELIGMFRRRGARD